MSDQSLAKVGDVIAHGEAIPANVRTVRDTHGDVHRRAGDLWAMNEQEGYEDPAPWSDEEVGEYAPLTVVEVDPEPQPDERRLIGPAHAHLDAPCTDACYESAELRAKLSGSETTVAAMGSVLDALYAALGVETDIEALAAIDRLKRERDSLARRCAVRFKETEQLRAELAAGAESGPVVLSLPQVDAVVRAARRWYYEHGYTPGYLPRNVLGSDRDLKLAVEQLKDAVEFAPPREPRTWEQLDSETYLPDAVDVTDAGGNVTRWTRPAHEFSWYSAEGMEDRPFIALRTLGEVREVLT